MIGLVDRIKKTAPDATRAAKDQSTPAPDPDTHRDLSGHNDQINKPAAAIPSPEPADLGAEYNRIWNQAWTLADYIDDPAAAPLADRKAKLPGLMQMRERMAEIVRQALPKAGPEPETSPMDAWMPWESSGAITREWTADTCPARCKQTGRCYGKSYFTGKPGPYPGPECDKDGCSWLNTEKVSVING
jgi:hypothetical protein